MRYLLISALAGLLAGQPSPHFEVASIRPSADPVPGQTGAGVQITQSQVRVNGLPLKTYLSIAYRMQTHQVTGPAWLGTTRFDIMATMPQGVNPQQLPEMFQTLLADRFKLQSHREMRETAVFALEVVKDRFTLEPVPADRDVTTTAAFSAGASASNRGVGVDLGRGSSYTFSDNRLQARKLMMGMLAQTLTNWVGRPVVDRTNLEGFYDFTVELTPEDFQAMQIRSADMAGVALPQQALRILESNTLDSLHESLRKIGLTLESRRAPMEVLVVDNIDKTPTEN